LSRVGADGPDSDSEMWSETRFRASGQFELVAREKLTADERSSLGGVPETSAFYGVLRPTSSSVSYKLINRQTAALFRLLRHPTRLPDRIRRMPDALDALMRLILDGVVEIESGVGFVTGPRAWAPTRMSVAGGNADLGPYRDVTGQLSSAALRYGAALRLTDPLALSERLYFFNRIPMTQSRRDDVDRLSREIAKRLTDADLDWQRLSAPSSSFGWHVWIREPAKADHEARYKIYASPRVDATEATAMACAAAFAEGGARAMKLGAGAHGLLRPDKLVGYFETLPQVLAVANRLRAELDGWPAQGVPFSAALEPSGMLSWGLDPEHSSVSLSWEGTSWRRFVTDRLALALIAAQLAGLTDPWIHARARVALEGVDPETWSPIAQPRRIGLTV
jgi:hypothetical protein